MKKHHKSRERRLISALEKCRAENRLLTTLQCSMSKSGYATIETMDWGDTLVRVGFAIQVEEIPRENLIAVITEAVTKQLRSFVAENPKFLKTAAKARALIMERERIQENASAQSAAKPQP